MERYYSFFFILGIFYFFPVFAVARHAPQNLFDLIRLFLNILNAFIPLLIGLALLGFLWGVAQFILAADDATKRKEGGKKMLWGIVALFVMISTWGLVALLANTFGIQVRFVPLLPGGLP